MSPCASNCVSKLSALTFFAKSWENDLCGLNGLPLTPNSISILGRFQFLKSIKHQNLTEYIDVLRGKHDRTIIVSEFFGRTLRNSQIPPTDSLNIIRVFYQIVNGLDFIHKQRLVHHNLEPENILLDDFYNVKLFNYGLYYMTRGDSIDEEYVSFPIGSIRYLAPERILGNHGNIKSDIWSLGLIISELLFGIPLWTSMKFSQIVRKVLSYCSNGGNILEKIAREHNCLEIYNNLDQDFKDLLDSCLSVSTKDRPSTENILKNELFQKYQENIEFKEQKISVSKMSPLERLELTQTYYLWQLTGGDVQVELKKAGMIRSDAPILTIPKLILLNGKSISAKKNQSTLFDDRIVFLNTNNLTERLTLVPKRAFYPQLYMPRLDFNYVEDMQSLPLVIRERNIEYQFHRVILFARLLKGYPFTRDLIVEEAKKDIPPFLRGRIWAALLNVVANGKYDKIDKITPTPTDRQIEVDIPRCHQYDELLSSQTGHLKLKRLLKAWVTAHPQYVYWQGLDSLTAPFLFLNFNNEELAFLSLYNFIPKYLHYFFLKDNSMIIKEYLSKFSQLVMFHEPALARHLCNISFIPELFSIPWFLTMFSHVFPIHKILILWDKLILGDSSYPLYVGISILKQLKGTLMESGFNECILLFSDLPDIVMEQCVIDSELMYDKTPKSIAHRKYVLRHTEPGILDINNVELSDIQNEISPRISGNDLVNLLKTNPDSVVVIDLRITSEFKRSHIENSINIPFTSITGDRRLEALNLKPELLDDKIVVIISVSHENACLFANFLVDCNVSMVCVLHNSINILHATTPNILVSS
ncbi:unnamed protein product [Diamesa hyperborea]